MQAEGIADNPVLAGSNWENSITVEGRENKPGEDTMSYINAVSPGYFGTLGIRIESGRVFRESDTAARPKVVVVNESFAEHYFGRQSAVGRRIGRGGDPGTRTDMEIIGVVNDTSYEDLQQKAPRQVFLCAAQAYEFDTTVYLKVNGDARSVLASARRLVHEMEPKAPIMNMKTMEHQLEESLVTERMIASLSAGFSALATSLSILGLYGVMAYMVTQRAREIGIRMAFGALSGSVVWLLMREVVLIVAIGIAVALPLAFGLGRLVRSELFGIQPADPASLVLPVLLLTAIALLAGFIPARRAASSDPLHVLRYE
ncbi:MAG TPA: FtsX-like permease family protein [Bryobacteraceae bacterium]|nr:FtsX-like permease family protein [Bryobacteraceae bacterium]